MYIDERVSYYWSLIEKGLIYSSYLDALSGYLARRFENSTDISFLFDSIDFWMKLEEEAEASFLEFSNKKAFYVAISCEIFSFYSKVITYILIPSF